MGARKHVHKVKSAAVMDAFEIIDVSREIAERSVSLQEIHGMNFPMPSFWLLPRAEIAR
ncbi:hypothetical protein [Lelliottia amnigena]|uniref:hypothetical protein n=1 Tax=Lelliottia amnigena TaxID=61646 RepID=UPI001F23EBB7|nr:hypothetical protein [Lelliottia amnigena]